MKKEVSDEQSAVLTGSSSDTDSENLDNENDMREHEAEIHAGVTDTMLTSPDFLEDSEGWHILNVAPAEGNRPLTIVRDKYCEELAYTIFINGGRAEWPGFKNMKARLGRPCITDHNKNGFF